MKDTRNFDRAPLKDIRVKDNQIGIRTPQILISRKKGDYMKGDVLDANATAELTKSIHVPDVDKINEKLEQTVNKDQIGKPNGVASLDQTGNVPIGQLGNIDTDLFMVVSELPTEDIKEGKIYCIRDTSSTAQDNGYIEYAYINNKWEKIGQFQAEPDLSGYAKLSGADFKGRVTFGNDINVTGYITARGGVVNSNLAGIKVLRDNNGKYIVTPNSNNPNIAYVTNGTLANIGTPEDFVFTLEDGSTVTKSIRVLSTTTSQAEA